MREIKFRAWLAGIGKMSYAHTLDELMNWNTKTEDNGTALWLQYTGLKDKNGKEIYEGDTIDWNDIKYKVCIGEFGLRDIESEGVTDIAYGVYGSAIGETLEPFCFDMQINSVWIKQDGIEVIGNIYENPEILK